MPRGDGQAADLVVVGEVRNERIGVARRRRIEVELDHAGDKIWLGHEALLQSMRDCCHPVSTVYEDRAAIRADHCRFHHNLRFNSVKDGVTMSLTLLSCQADKGGTMALDRDQIVRTALTLLDQVGLEGLSLRKIAGELGVQAPALYWHMRNKQELLDEMATTMLRDVMAESVPPDSTAPWPEHLTAMGSGLRHMLLGHRDGARVFSGTYLTDDSLLGGMEPLLRALVNAGFSLPQAVAAYSTVYSYTIGFVIEEQAVRPSRADDTDERYSKEWRSARVDANAYPLALAAGELMFSGYDERFAAGVALIVRGVAAALE